MEFFHDKKIGRRKDNVMFLTQQHKTSKLSTFKQKLLSARVRNSAEVSYYVLEGISFNPLNADLNPIYHLLALLAAHHILHVSRIRVNIFLRY
jgi:hypothetical protein